MTEGTAFLVVFAVGYVLGGVSGWVAGRFP